LDHCGSSGVEGYQFEVTFDASADLAVAHQALGAFLEKQPRARRLTIGGIHGAPYSSTMDPMRNARFMTLP